MGKEHDMKEKTTSLTEITRLREQMQCLYIRDKRVSEAVLNASTALDKHIYAYMKSTTEG